jgi:hypothetical protein
MLKKVERQLNFVQRTGKQQFTAIPKNLFAQKIKNLQLRL